MKNRDRYPAEWESEIRPAILTRDKFRCQHCKIKQNTRYYRHRGLRMIVHGPFEESHAKTVKARIMKIGLQVAHLDQNPSNNEFSNLLSLCPDCHLKNDHEFNKLKRLGKRT